MRCMCVMLRRCFDGKLHQRQRSVTTACIPTSKYQRRCAYSPITSSTVNTMPTTHHTSTPLLRFKTMPLRLWPKRSKRNNPRNQSPPPRKRQKTLRHHARRLQLLERNASGHGLTRRIKALKTRQEDTDAVLLRLMRDVTVAERKLNRVLPGDDSDDEDDGDAELRRSASGRTSSLDVVSNKNVGPTLAPGETPATFTRRKSNSAERVTLDGSSTLR